MSQKLINLNPDLKQLQDDGHEIEIIGSYLVMKHVPYVNSQRQVKYGVLVSSLSLAGDRTVRPNTHVMLFDGEMPCDQNGQALSKIVNGTATQMIGNGLSTKVSFSSKPACGHYKDYCEKFVTYAGILSHQAQAIIPSATAQTYNVIESIDNDIVFKYLDTASSRAGISEISRKLQQDKIAIIGMGGTGAYVLDFIAKMPVKEIHIYDDDILLSHNAFRSPGCMSAAQLRKKVKKVTHYKRLYSYMHRGIVSHRSKVTRRNVNKLHDCDFVFLCIDDNVARNMIINKLLEYGVPFVDVGMGIEKCNDSLVGQVRTTYCSLVKTDHVHSRVPMAANEDGDDLYTSNIQTVELNALNAVLAVMKWKKHCGFYVDLEHEHHSIFSIDGNHILNEEIAS